MTTEILKRLDDLETAVRYLGGMLENMQADNLNRDVRLSLIEGRLDGVGDETKPQGE